MIKITISEEIVRNMPQRYEMLSEITGDTSTQPVQEEIKSLLMQDPAWVDWIKSFPPYIRTVPVYIKAGLNLKRDDEGARKLFIGLARCIEADSYVAPYYAIDNLAVTEVIAEPGIDAKESHSKNDLPAPPHIAAFFEKVPPHTCYFACIRSHPYGGGETTVVNLEAVLEDASSALIDEWKNKTYYLRTSKRLGNKVIPFRLLTSIDGLPFLRYRKEYTEGFDDDPSLTALQKLACNLDNHYTVLLQADEVLAFWNGAPHSRLPQRGKTPEEVHARRKLIRCRTQPISNWEENFEYTF